MCKVKQIPKHCMKHLNTLNHFVYYYIRYITKNTLWRIVFLFSLLHIFLLLVINTVDDIYFKNSPLVGSEV